MGSPRGNDKARQPQIRRKTGGQYAKGTTGNPGGRPSTRWIRDYLAEIASQGTTVTRRQAVVTALFHTAIERSHKDHVRAGELLLAYEAGKPIQSVELSGPEGGPLEGIDMMTSEKQNERMRELLAKAAARGAVGGAKVAEPEVGEADGGDEQPSE